MTATFGNSSAAVTWTAPADGGSPITSYTVTTVAVTPGAFVPGPVIMSEPTPPTQQITTTMINGLTNGATYQFFVSATNAIGTSSSSALSNTVIPVAQPANPNNIGPTAVGLGILNCGFSITATGDNTTGTHAWYQFTFNQAAFPAAPCTLTVNLSGPDVFDVHVGAFTQTPAPPTGETTFSTTTGGTYFIDVYGDTGGNNFNLLVGTH